MCVFVWGSIICRPGWEDIFRMNQKQLEAAIRRVSADPSLEPQVCGCARPGAQEHPANAGSLGQGSRWYAAAASLRCSLPSPWKERRAP